LAFARVLGVFLSFAFLSSALHQAQGVTLLWDRAASHTNLSAYVVKYGVTSGSYTGQMSVVASQTSATVNNLTPGLTYYFVVTAKDTSNVESDPSNQISYTVPAVNANAPPTLNPISSLTVAEDAGLQTISLTGISPGAANEPQTVTVTSVSSNPSLIPHPTVNYVRPSSTGALKFTPVANASGNANVTVTVRDSAASNNVVARSFVVTVSPSGTVPALRVRVTPGRQVVLTVTGQPGHTHEIQATENFTTWTVINTVTLSASGSMDLIDANAASFPRRFYRVRDTSDALPTVRVRVTPSRQVVLTVTGQTGHTHEIQATQNFTTWTVINTVTLGASGSMDVIDANAASFPRRFYRVRDTQ